MLESGRAGIDNLYLLIFSIRILCCSIHRKWSQLGFCILFGASVIIMTY